MAGIENWFTFKSEAQRRKEYEEYDKRLFPHGPKQKEKIAAILKDLLLSYDHEISMYQYLVCKDALLSCEDRTLDREKIETLAQGIRHTLKKKNRDDIYRLCALCEADLCAGGELIYPDAVSLLNRAQELKGAVTKPAD